MIGRGFESRSGRKEGEAATQKPARLSASIQLRIIPFCGLDGNPTDWRAPGLRASAFGAIRDCIRSPPESARGERSHIQMIGGGCSRNWRNSSKHSEQTVCTGKACGDGCSWTVQARSPVQARRRMSGWEPDLLKTNQS